MPPLHVALPGPRRSAKRGGAASSPNGSRPGVSAPRAAPAFDVRSLSSFSGAVAASKRQEAARRKAALVQAEADRRHREEAARPTTRRIVVAGVGYNARFAHEPSGEEIAAFKVKTLRRNHPEQFRIWAQAGEDMKTMSRINDPGRASRAIRLRAAAMNERLPETTLHPPATQANRRTYVRRDAPILPPAPKGETPEGRVRRVNRAVQRWTYDNLRADGWDPVKAGEASMRPQVAEYARAILQGDRNPGEAARGSIVNPAVRAELARGSSLKTATQAGTKTATRDLVPSLDYHERAYMQGRREDLSPQEAEDFSNDPLALVNFYHGVEGGNPLGARRAERIARVKERAGFARDLSKRGAEIGKKAGPVLIKGTVFDLLPGPAREKASEFAGSAVSGAFDSVGKVISPGPTVSRWERVAKGTASGLTGGPGPDEGEALETIVELASLLGNPLHARGPKPRLHPELPHVVPPPVIGESFAKEAVMDRARGAAKAGNGLFDALTESRLAEMASHHADLSSQIQALEKGLGAGAKESRALRDLRNARAKVEGGIRDTIGEVGRSGDSLAVKGARTGFATSSEVGKIVSLTDVGATIRQGKLLAVDSPLSGVRSLFDSVKSIGEQEFLKLQRGIMGDARFTEARRVGLHLEDPMSTFRGSSAGPKGLIGRTRYGGAVLDAMERSKAAGLNRLRMDAWNRFRRQMPHATEAEMREVAEYLNHATGHGPKPGGLMGEVAGGLANDVGGLTARYKAPMAMLGNGPAAKIAQRQFGRMTGAYAALAGSAVAAGATISLDPDSDDFLKIRVPGLAEPFNLGADYTSTARLLAKWVRGGSDPASPIARRFGVPALEFLQNELATHLDRSISTARSGRYGKSGTGTVPGALGELFGLDVAGPAKAERTVGFGHGSIALPK